MKYLLSVLFFLLFIITPIKASADVITGVQLPNVDTMKRLVPSQYSFQWVKFQYQLGTNPQALKDLIFAAKGYKREGGPNYKVLISIAKNTGDDKIEVLKNPITDYPVGQKPDVYSKEYCPWGSDLESYTFPQTCTDEKGIEYSCPEVIQSKPYPNGYTKFMNKLKDLAPYLQEADAVEVWNEPNLADEWSAPDVNLGPVDAKNYVNFLNCGIKGLRKDNVYKGTIISAGLAPNAYTAELKLTSINDITFFNTFIAEGGAKQVDAIGWHSNVTTNISPNTNYTTDPNGFQRVKYALDKGKPVWLTEFGWNRDNLPGTEEDKRQLQSQYIAEAYDVINKDYKDKVNAMFVWNFGFGDLRSEFAPWDIEGVVPKGQFCQPNPKTTDGRVRGNTQYVQDKSLTDDVAVAVVAGRALIPKAVIDDANGAQAGVQTILETRVDAKKSFLSTTPGFNLLLSILSKFCGLFGFNSAEYCRPNLSIGSTETNDPNVIAKGKNTPEFAAQAGILGKTAIPANMELTAEDKDCNIGKLSTNSDPGNTNINELSENLGTTTGFYGNGMMNFKNLTPDDWETSIRDRMQAENLNISNKLFVQDKRSPDIYLRKQVFCKGNYPNGICPFEPAPVEAI